MPRYSEATKAAAIKEVVEKMRPASQVAKERKITPGILYGWIKQHRASGNTLQQNGNGNGAGSIAEQIRARAIAAATPTPKPEKPVPVVDPRDAEIARLRRVVQVLLDA